MCQVKTGAYVALFAPGKIDYTACHPGKTTTYILLVVPVTTHTHVRRKSIGNKKQRKERRERKEKKRNEKKRNEMKRKESEKGKEIKKKARKARKYKTRRGSKEQ